MIYKDKKKIKEGLKNILASSDKIKSITKTGFIDELEKLKKNIKIDNIFDYILLDLEGKDVESLKEQLKTKVWGALSFIDKSEEEIIKNLLKKTKHTHTILADEKNKITLYLSKIANKKNIKINFVSSLKDNKTHPEHIDFALVPIDKIDSRAHIYTNKKNISIIKEANKEEIPVYCYIHSWNYVSNTKSKGVKPDMVKAIISELGIFEPEIFIQEIKLRYPWLF